MTHSNILDNRLHLILDKRRQGGRLMDLDDPRARKTLVDFGSNDTLSLSTSGLLTKAFLDELGRHPDFTIGSTSSRLGGGTSQYLAELEEYVAEFHRAEAALFANSGYDANVAIWSTLPQRGDVVVYDEYVHASIHDGMRASRAELVSFLHNNCDSLREQLTNIKLKYSDISLGKKVIFISLESFYSMDGDAPPIRQMIALAKELFPLGNALLVIDEAHSNGLLGPRGSGFVNYHGLENEFAVRLNTCGKGLGSTGAFVLGSKTIKEFLTHYARSLIYTTLSSFPTLTAIKVGYELIGSVEGDMRRKRLYSNIQLFYETLITNPRWSECEKLGIITAPTSNGWEHGSFLSPIVPLVTAVGKAKELGRTLKESGYWVIAVYYPVVPVELERVRLSIHADNTSEQIQGVVKVIMEWAVGVKSNMFKL
ncbi:pyridoxal phosphate-dependent transferase [Xylogone sp. PMI_703]|nr:pyridoxal phosphate-dependent transferase [Xylogone sp. PMI_703]